MDANKRAIGRSVSLPMELNDAVERWAYEGRKSFSTVLQEMIAEQIVREENSPHQLRP